MRPPASISAHTSEAFAMASVLMPEIIAALTRAQDNDGPERLEYLSAARDQCWSVIGALYAAIDKEIAAHPPTVTPRATPAAVEAMHQMLRNVMGRP